MHYRIESAMPSKVAMQKSLQPFNKVYFSINDYNSYYYKMRNFGKSLVIRANDTLPISFLFYYDNLPHIFISMIWTHPKYQGNGYAKILMRHLINRTNKNIFLRVQKNNPAVFLYLSFGFKTIKTERGEHLMLYKQENHKHLKSP